VKGVGRRIVVVGKVGMDILVRLDAAPRSGESVLGEGMELIPGGKGANQAVAASRLGAKVSFISRVGDDEFGRRLVSYLKKESLDASCVKISNEAPTGTTVVMLDRNHDNTMVSIPGITKTLSVADLDPVELTGSDIVVTQLGVPQEVVIELLKRAKSAGATTILNGTPRIKVPKSTLELADYLIVNEYEAAFFAGEDKVSSDPDIVSGYAKKIRTSASQVVIVTVGESGSIALDRDKIIRVAGLKVNVVDTTGAGDCFIGAFAKALSEDKSLEEALNFANKAASICVQRMGASAALPTLEEVNSSGV